MPTVLFNQRRLSELNQCKCKITFEQPHLLTRHVWESTICLHINPNGGYSWTSLCFNSSSLQGRHGQYKSGAWMVPYCWCVAVAKLSLYYPLLQLLSPRQREAVWEQLCGGSPSKTQSFLLVNLFLCARCLAGCGMGRLLPNNISRSRCLWKASSALARWSQFTRRSKLFEHNSDCSFIITRTEFPRNRKIITAMRSDPFYSRSSSIFS